MISESTFITENRKKSVRFIAVFLAILTLITTLQMSRITSFAEDNGSSSVSEYLTTDEKANSWQIVSGKYTGNTANEKTTYSGDGSVRVQKNVIPTDVENEFLVYLSIDMKEEITEEQYETFFTSNFGIVSAGSYTTANVGKWYDTLPSGTVKGIGTVSSGGHNKPIYITIKNPQGTVILNDVVMYMDVNNAAFYLHTGGKYLIIHESVSKNSHISFQLDVNSYDFINTQVRKTVTATPTLTRVDDVMSGQILFDKIIGGDYTSKPNCLNGTLEWIPRIKSDVAPFPEETKVNDTTTITTNWYCNVAELLYRVKLDVTKSGFVVDEEYDVNQSATLTYDGDKKVLFPKPKVKGRLYGFKFTKVDSLDCTALSGAEFELTGGGKTYNAVSREEGVYTFEKIPWGSYTLTEKEAPTGYVKSDENTWSINIGGRTSFSSENEFEQAYGKENGFYRLKSWDTKKIENEPVTDVTVTKVVSGEGANYSKDFKFKYSLKNHSDKSGEFELNVSTKNSEILKDLYIGDTLFLEEIGNDEYDVDIKVNDEDYSAQDGITITKDMKITVTNTRKTANVTVTKKVDGDIEKDSFGFSYSYETTDGIKGNGSIDVKKDKNESFKVPTGSTVTLKETTSTDYYVDSVKIGNQSLEADNNGNYTFIVNSDTAVTVTNKPVVKNTTITVKKHVTGNMGDREKEFEFTVEINGTDTGEPFRLKDTGEYQLTVPIGAKIVITETNSDDYITISNFDSESITGNSTITIDSVPQNGGTVEFTNKLNESIDTGITLDSVPYVISIIGVISLFAFMMIKRRRHAEN